MPYQYVREPLTAEEADRLSTACESPTEQLIVWTFGHGLHDRCDSERHGCEGTCGERRPLCTSQSAGSG